MPAGLHDGAIIVDTGLNNAGFNRDARQYKAAANSLKNAVNRISQSMGKSGEKYTQALANQVKAERELNKQIDKTREKYADVVREMNELQKTGGSKSRYDELSEQAKGLAAKLSELRQAKQNLGGVSASFDRVAESAGKARRNIVGIVAGGAWSYLKKVAAGAKNAAVQLAKLASRAVTSGMKKLAAYALGAARGLFGLGKGARDSGRGFQFSLKNLLKYGLGIRSLFVLFNRLRSAIKEGFGALKEYDPRVRASLASLSAALNSLKGASAAAFAPILNAIAPALTTLINLVTQATNALGMFFAALTGQSYYSVAKGVASIGSSAKSSSGSVKELKRQLAGFDELNILSAGSSGGSGGGGGGASSGISYEQTPIAAGIKNFVEQIKALVADENWDGLGGMIAEKINGALDKARALISWRNIGGKITEVMQGITGTINGFVNGIDWPNVGATLAEGLNTVVNTALLWYRGIDWAKLGRSLAEALNGLIRRIDWEKIGDLIQSKLKALFDFTKNFVITFDEIAAARAIRTALGRIDWPTLARDFWDTAKTAFKKAGNFLKVLMGGDVYDVAGNAVDQMWERGSGKASSQTYATSWVKVFAQKVGQLLGSIPWPSILEQVKKSFLDAFDGLLDGLFNSENGDVVLKIAAAIAGLKIAPKIIASLLGGGAGAGAAGTSAGLGATGSILSALGITGIAGYLTGQKVWDDFKNNHQDVIEDVVNALVKFVEGRKLDTNKTYEGTGNALADVSAWLLGGTDALDKIESAVGTWEQVAEAFVKNGGDASGWNKLFNGPQGYTYGRDASNDEIMSLAKLLLKDGYSFEEIQKALNLNTDQLKNLEELTRGNGLFGKLGDWLTGTDRSKTNTTDYLRAAFSADGGDLAGWDEAFNDNTKALDKNTKATNKQTRQTRLTEKQAAAPSKVKAVQENIFQHVKTDASTNWDTSGWQAAFDGVKPTVNATVDFIPGGMASYINKPLEWLKKVFAPGTDTQTRVALLKNWTGATTADWMRNMGYLSGTAAQIIGAVKGWTGSTIADWFKNAGFLSGMATQSVGAAKGWTGNKIADWMRSLGYLSGTAAQSISVAKGWTGNKIADWIKSAGYLSGSVAQSIGAAKGWNGSTVADWMRAAGYLAGQALQTVNPAKGWNGSTVADWMRAAGYLAGYVLQTVNPAKGWNGSTIADWMRGAGYLVGYVSQAIGLSNGWGYSTVGGWASQFVRDLVDQSVGLSNGWGFGTVGGWVGQLVRGFVDQAVALSRGWGNKTVTSWVDSQVVGQVIQTVSLVVDTVKTVAGVVLNFANKAAGGIITAGGQMLNFAAGGIIRGGMASCWNSIPKYAAGTAAAHGTLFTAGEAGPEIVGHINGRTEILNQSQLAQTMRAATYGGMVQALNGLTFRMPAMATGGIMPYEVSAQIARSASDIQDTLDANHEDLIQTIISLAGKIVAAVQRVESRGAAAGAGGMNAQQIIDEINRRTQMFAASPLKGV